MNAPEVNQYDNLPHTRFRKSQVPMGYKHYEKPLVHATVDPCGHRMVVEEQPTGNCLYCWFAWFNHHGEIVQLTDEIVQKHGPETIIRMRGKKYWKFFCRFMAILQEMKRQSEEQNVRDDRGNEVQEGRPSVGDDAGRGDELPSSGSSVTGVQDGGR